MIHKHRKGIAKIFIVLNAILLSIDLGTGQYFAFPLIGLIAGILYYIG